MILQVPGQGPTSYLDAAQREKALQQMQQMSSAQIVSATAHMQPRMGPPVTYGGFWQHPGALGIFVETARCWQCVTLTLISGLGQIQTSPHDVKPFAQSPFSGLQDTKTPVSGLGMGGMAALAPASPQLGTPAPAPAWQGRSIGNNKLRLLEFSAYVEQPRDSESYDKHLFVNIGQTTSFSDPMLEVSLLINSEWRKVAKLCPNLQPVDVRQIQDKFPEKKEGLKELFEKGPQDAFFLVKFWADLNTAAYENEGAFYGVTSTWVSNTNQPTDLELANF